jgi:hypothetical protein
MKVYRADPAAVDAFIRQRRLIGLVVRPIMMVGILASLAVQVLLRDHPISALVEPASLIVAAWLVAILAFCMLVAMLVALYPGPRAQALYVSYMLEVTDDDLRRYQEGLSPHTVHRSEVARISEHSSGIVVLTAKGWKLKIPRYLDGYDEVRETLLGWRPFETDRARDALSTALPIATSIVWVGGFATMQYARLGRWWNVGAIVFLAAQAWMIRIWLKELRNPELTKSGRYAMRGIIIGYTILFVAVLIGLLSAFGT